MAAFQRVFASRAATAHPDAAADSDGSNGAPISDPARFWENSIPAVPDQPSLGSFGTGRGRRSGGIPAG